jgi:hypothetical protein
MVDTEEDKDKQFNIKGQDESGRKVRYQWNFLELPKFSTQINNSQRPSYTIITISILNRRISQKKERNPLKIR